MSPGIRAARAPWLLWSVALVLLGGGTGWAFATILTPPPEILDTSPFTYAEVVEGEVGSHLNLNVAAQWTMHPVGTNEASGVVTTVDTAAGSLLDQGSTLYTVNLRPVVIARGPIPAYRPIVQGSTGADVAQLQTMLTELGFYSGSIDGDADSSTVAAIIRWHKAIGLEETGEVAFGDVIFVPTLPTRIALATDVVKRSATLAGGESVVLGLSDSPGFTLPVSESQSAAIPSGTRVAIDDGAGGSWIGYAADRAKAESGSSVTIELASHEAGSICADHCDRVPIIGQTLLAAQIMTVETVRGVVVPSTALQTSADQRVSVIDFDGVSHVVTVVASARGVSVVSGVEPGLRVRVPASVESR